MPDLHPSKLGALFAHHATTWPDRAAYVDENRTVTYAQLAEDGAAISRQWDERVPFVWIDTADTYAGIAAIVAAWTDGRGFGLLAAREEPALGGALYRAGETAPSSGPVPEQIDGQLVVFPTSGTTGTPRLVAHTDTSLTYGLLASLAVQAELLGVALPAALDEIDGHSIGAFATGSVLCIGMGLATISGYTVAQRTLAVGDTYAPLDVSDPSRILGQLGDLHALNAAVPALTATLLCRHLRTNGTPEHRPELASFGIGGAIVAPELAAELEDLLGCVVTNGYGSTELGGPALIGRITDPPDVRHRGVGRPLPGVEARIDDADSDGWGRLWVASPAGSIGVLGEDATLRRWPDRWLDSGDIGRIRADGTFEIGGRADELIMRGGRRIDPAPIRARLLSHPDVDAAVVFGTPSQIPGEFDVAALVAGTASEADLRQWVAGHGAARVRHLRVLSALPLARDGNVSITAARACVTADTSGPS